MIPPPQPQGFPPPLCRCTPAPPRLRIVILWFALRLPGGRLNCFSSMLGPFSPQLGHLDALRTCHGSLSMGQSRLWDPSTLANPGARPPVPAWWCLPRSLGLLARLLWAVLAMFCRCNGCCHNLCTPHATSSGAGTSFHFLPPSWAASCRLELCRLVECLALVGCRCCYAALAEGVVSFLH